MYCCASGLSSKSSSSGSCLAVWAFSVVVCRPSVVVAGHLGQAVVSAALLRCGGCISVLEVVGSS